MARRRKTGSQTKIGTLMKQGEWQAAERLLLHELAEAERRDDHVLVAQCHSNLGNVAEAQNRVGDAFRHWSKALVMLKRLRLAQKAEGERLHSLLRLWHDNPRVWVSYSHVDKARVEHILAILRH